MDWGVEIGRDSEERKEGKKARRKNGEGRKMRVRYV
jgi:hypothetical protein